jgi:hypothetical protein
LLYEHIVKKLIRDGIALAYEEAGSGLPPMRRQPTQGGDSGGYVLPASLRDDFRARTTTSSPGMERELRRPVNYRRS